MWSESRWIVGKAWYLGPLAVLLIAGCGPRQSADEAMSIALSNAGASKETVYPLGGTVTIDGQPPNLNKNDKIVVMLNDPAHPEVPLLHRTHTSVGADGSFHFATYRPGDGVVPGKYVVTFALLQRKGKFGLAGPDRLNNLYNDPDKNATVEGFAIDHKAPGKSDYYFDLAIAGKEAGTPGPHSMTNLVDEAIPGAARVKH
ncbi:MAG TPA: hypothetical protein VEI07_13995 [Planctomycetaceae bacterium]|nr:hypothetical protein [Planctomycetaceae bacterium]